MSTQETPKDVTTARIAFVDSLSPSQAIAFQELQELEQKAKATSAASRIRTCDRRSMLYAKMKALRGQ